MNWIEIGQLGISGAMLPLLFGIFYRLGGLNSVVDNVKDRLHKVEKRVLYNE